MRGDDDLYGSRQAEQYEAERLATSKINYLIRWLRSKNNAPSVLRMRKRQLDGMQQQGVRVPPCILFPVAVDFVAYNRAA